MKIINNKIYLGTVLFGLFNILFGALERLNIIPPSGPNPGLPSIVAGMIILAIGLYLSRKPESEVMIDERIRKRAMKANTAAFLITFLYVVFLMLFDMLWSVNLINLGDSFLGFPSPGDFTHLFPRYMSIILVAIISVTALGIYYNKKGDVE
ncbi:MAG: hypothetical protein O8C66_13290 [Candidatus Methanoperedens sp.]|nr:hypothetical protein [Candidatus Methanoperedens sp.]MCZ7371472.1 hypothetical protein [Candidatus Methanoperedens sp.]